MRKALKLNDTKIQVRFPQDLWEDIKQIALENERSANSELIWALRKYTAERKGDKSREQDHKSE